MVTPGDMARLPFFKNFWSFKKVTCQALLFSGKANNKLTWTGRSRPRIEVSIPSIRPLIQNEQSILSHISTKNVKKKKQKSKRS
jgi:hypothetical protein